jgi:hypothetical protein
LREKKAKKEIILRNTKILRNKKQNKWEIDLNTITEQEIEEESKDQIFVNFSRDNLSKEIKRKEESKNEGNDFEIDGLYIHELQRVQDR